MTDFPGTYFLIGISGSWGKWSPQIVALLLLQRSQPLHLVIMLAERSCKQQRKRSLHPRPDEGLVVEVGCLGTGSCDLPAYVRMHRCERVLVGRYMHGALYYVGEAGYANGALHIRGFACPCACLSVCLVIFLQVTMFPPLS